MHKLKLFKIVKINKETLLLKNENKFTQINNYLDYYCHFI